jgi:hypothetical protein
MGAIKKHENCYNFRVYEFKIPPGPMAALCG